VADIRRGIGADNRVERLPWLEPVEDEGDYGSGGARRWAAIGLGALGLIALLIVGVVVVMRWHAAHADIGGIIRAPAGPYKVKPAQAGGLASATSDQVAEQTGTGADVDAPLALVGAEQPVVGPGAQAAEAGATQPRPAPTAKAAMVLPNPKPATPPPPAVAGAAPTPVPATGGGTVQLGAFGSEAKAKAAWKNLSKRFAYLAPMNVSILSAEVNGTTVYRLRASGGEPASQICARLELAGEACAVIG
jgi:hypothetical protein